MVFKKESVILECRFKKLKRNLKKLSGELIKNPNGVFLKIVIIQLTKI